MLWGCSLRELGLLGECWCRVSGLHFYHDNMGQGGASDFNFTNPKNTELIFPQFGRVGFLSPSVFFSKRANTDLCDSNLRRTCICSTFLRQARTDKSHSNGTPWRIVIGLLYDSATIWNTRISTSHTSSLYV